MTSNTEWNNTVEFDLNSAYRGESYVDPDQGITLVQAIARIAAEFYDPHQRYDRESGQYVESNAYDWDQRIALQSLGNFAWRQMHDTSTDNQGRVRGISHKLEKAKAHLKQTLAQADGTEISLAAINRAVDWVERFEAQLCNLEDFFHTAAAVYEAAVGEPFKPYEGWTAKKDTSKKAASETAKSELEARLAAMGLSLPDNYEPQTNGVETSELDADVA